MNGQYSKEVHALLSAQNADGGWGYRGGGSWTEPSAYALLALAREPLAQASVRRGVRWLIGLQRPDGGWPPRPSLDQSTSVTAVALLALHGGGDRGVSSRATEWLLRQSGRDSTFLYRLRMRLLGSRENQTVFRGWPWYPGTAAWVTPTALSILALERMRRSFTGAGLTERVESGKSFLWSRICSDGGWHHGATKALGYDADSYPETTGIAVLALRGSRAPGLPAALAAAERHLRACRSAEGLAWLRLGLLAHSRPVTDVPMRNAQSHSVLDLALTLLADRAASGDHPFLS